jgi:hypothetical protein
VRLLRSLRTTIRSTSSSVSSYRFRLRMSRAQSGRARTPSVLLSRTRLCAFVRCWRSIWSVRSLVQYIQIMQSNGTSGPPGPLRQSAALCCDVLCCACVGMVAGHAPKQVRDVLLHQRSASRPLRQPEDEGPTGKPRLQSSPVDRYCTTLYACVQPACSDWIYWICYLRLESCCCVVHI